MKNLDLKSLRLWVSVCEFQSIKKAAVQAHIEPSAVSKRVAHLEATLGADLLVRGRYGVTPTAAGLALLEHARIMLYNADQMEADVAAYAGGLKGRVRVAASASAVAESLLDDVALFMRDPHHRGIQVDIEERLTTDVVRLVKEGAVSLGVCWNVSDLSDLSGLSTHAYRQDHLMVTVHPDHPLARRKSIRFEETLDYDHVGLPPSTAVYAMLNRAAAQAGRTLTYRVVVSNFDAALRVVKANLGLSVIPREVSLVQAAQGDIVSIALREPWARRDFVVCTRADSAPTAAATKLLTHLQHQAQISGCSGRASGRASGRVASRA